MLFVSKTCYLNISTQKFKCGTYNSFYIDKAKRHLLVISPLTWKFRFIGLCGKGIKVYRKRCNSNQKKLSSNEYRCSVDNFERVRTAVNDFHLKLKESLLILEMKSCLNIARESMPLYLFDRDSLDAVGK